MIGSRGRWIRSSKAWPRRRALARCRSGGGFTLYRNDGTIGAFNNKNVLNGRTIMYLFALHVVLEISNRGTGAVLAATALVLALSLLALLTRGRR